MSLEDDFCDIIKKSRHGQSLSLASVAQQSRLSRDDLEALEKGSRLPNSDEVGSPSRRSYSYDWSSRYVLRSQRSTAGHSHLFGASVRRSYSEHT